MNKKLGIYIPDINDSNFGLYLKKCFYFADNGIFFLFLNNPNAQRIINNRNNIKIS